jgi:cyclomaltodextrinase / maltogenic alpha-amylase / neopullulanase
MRALASGILIAACLWPASSQSQGQGTVPEWAKDAIWYQIFPERFRNGDTSNDPTRDVVWLPTQRPWHVSRWGGDWYALQEWEQATGRGFYDVVFDRRYGGDLAGVLEKLDYLKDLGITALYFNPVFESPSLHKYDASSYHHIDANFGPNPAGDRALMQGETDEASRWHWTAADSMFVRLVDEAHRRGIRVIIDGVFNHCGIRFWAFEDVRKNQQASPYAAWFDVVSWDDPATPKDEFDYKAWWGFKLHPEFHEDEGGFPKSLREYFFAITRRWMDPNNDGDPSDGIDGWRLDVPNDVSPVFWRQWRNVVKGINPEAYIVGEIWDNASEWLNGDLFDAVMNYRYARAVVRFFIDTDGRRLTVTAFDAELKNIRASHPDEVNFVLQNLIDSHDTDRLASMIANANRTFDDKANPRQNPSYDVRKPTASERQVQRLVVLFQMTSLGAPMIYYGDEAGMWGGDDPDNRKPMVWPDITFDPEASHPLRGQQRAPDSVRFDDSMLDYYRSVIGVRRQHPALRRGDMRPVVQDDAAGVYAFTRATDNDTVLVMINNSDREQRVRIPLAGPWQQVWKTGTVVREQSEPLLYLMDRRTGVILTTRD